MEVRYNKKFLKQLASVPSETRVKIEGFVFDELISASSIFSLGKIEKMQGYHGFYKVRFGNYRVGLAIENEVVIVKTVMHRRDIYKFFP
ncbi:type II toxin-antitoxin system RelE family toxin [Candidatus Methylomicrobium oryzae]|uniref:type II toxin-antitoxin system RelE family toxin n=1 Tax=Candidatus Methylomicrobium oryzae TaxID=2802053 RepID=UPI001920E33A|nr:type II toxin-antitoxin system RelE/ParE family toxin [Methylomicrobium sp. RS1]MBL1262425.1 type II toxin-antitoxin system RelE/ParE family toxin [Methylomicrobium sp. RS1]